MDPEIQTSPLDFSAELWHNKVKQEVIIMPKKKYTAEFKTKVILTIT